MEDQFPNSCSATDSLLEEQEAVTTTHGSIVSERIRHCTWDRDMRRSRPGLEAPQEDLERHSSTRGS